MEQKRAKLEQYGRRVWNVSTAEEALAKTEEFFHSLGMPTRLSDYQIVAEDAAERVRLRFTERQVAYGEHGDFGAADAVAVLQLRA